MRESRWPPPFTRALKRNLQGSFFCWVLGVDEVVRGGRMGFYIGLMGRIGLIRLIRQIRLIAQIRQLGVNRAYQANRQIKLVFYNA